MYQKICEFCDEPAAIILSIWERAPTMFCEKCYTSMQPPPTPQEINEQIKKIYGEMDDMKAYRGERADTFISLMGERIARLALEKGVAARHSIQYLQNIIDDFKVLEKDQDKHYRLLHSNLEALRKERDAALEKAKTVG
jgi:hypothetical protein